MRKAYWALHGLLAVYSLSTVLSKLAAGVPFLSLPFCLYYGGVLLLLAVYALGWQQIIKRMPLTTAYASKAVSVIWGLVWGILFFGETLTPGKAAGALLVIGGVVLFAFSDREEASPEGGRTGDSASSAVSLFPESRKTSDPRASAKTRSGKEAKEA